MTNGDMIKTMFPNVEVKEKNNGYEVYFGTGTAIQFFNHKWWNAPYRFGKWAKTDGEINLEGDWGTVYKCSCCNKTTRYPEKFCPNCGAEMGEVEE